MCKYKFQYGYAKNMTVTVRAKSKDEAIGKAIKTLDKRYEKAGKAGLIPTGWTLWSAK